jgi:hypothetical protein
MFCTLLRRNVYNEILTTYIRVRMVGVREDTGVHKEGKHQDWNTEGLSVRPCKSSATTDFRLFIYECATYVR